MKPATITAIGLRPLPGNINYQRIFVTTNGFDENRHRLILRVHGKFYDELSRFFFKDLVITPDKDSQNIFDSLFWEPETSIYAQLFDYKEDKVLSTCRQDFAKTLLTWQKEENLQKVSENYFNLYWHTNRRVSKIQGPYNQKGNLITSVKEGERYQFFATPNQKLNKVETLSIKWGYRYDDGDLVLFKNHSEEITSDGRNSMTCTFHKDPAKIKVYAFFVKESEEVMVEFTNSGKENYVSEAAAYDENIPQETTPAVQKTNTGKCFCGRALTEEEFKTIFEKLRDSEPDVKRDSKYKLFGATNCKISITEKNIKRLTEEFNKVAERYKITQCIQKIHFLSQIYWESDRFRTALEYASGSGYNPGSHAEAKKNGNTNAGDGPLYKGRGLLQLTWRNSQIKYLKYAQKALGGALTGIKEADLEKRENKYHELISNKMLYAMDSAGWFWSVQGKADFQKKQNKLKYKEIVDKTLNEISLFGDKYQERISIIVNGGGNGKAERKEYYASLKQIFNYKECINNTGSPKDQSSSAPAPDNGTPENNTGETSGSGTSRKFVVFDKSLSEDRKRIVSEKTLNIVNAAAQSSNSANVIISSTIRSTRKQAEAMFTNEQNGKHINYKPPGKAVINVYKSGKKQNLSKEAIINNMDKEIISQYKNGKRVSLHCVPDDEYRKLNIIDVTYTRGKINPEQFIRSISKNPNVKKIIQPISKNITGNNIVYDTGEAAIHIEIQQ